MNSTTAPKAIGPDDVVVARADERLVHAYDQIARADEQLARLNEQLARLESEAKQHPSAVVGHRPSRGGRALRGFIGLLLAAGIFAFAFVSQSSYGDAAKSTVARWAPQLIASRPGWKNRGARATEPIWRSTGRGHSRASAIDTLGPDGRAGRRAGSRPDSGRAGAVAPDDGARSRKRGAGDRAAQGKPGTNGPRQCEGHRGDQGEPGANDAPHRQAFRHNKVSEQDLRPRTTAPTVPPIAAPTQTCAGASVAASQGAAAGPDTVAARRRPVVVLGSAATETSCAGRSRPDLATDSGHRASAKFCLTDFFNTSGVERAFAR